jgi:hypothetical protein
MRSVTATPPESLGEEIITGLGGKEEASRARNLRMTPRKRTQITIETERVVTIRRRRAKRAFCPECGCEVDMVSLAEVGALTGQPQLKLADSKSVPGWHVSEGADGSPVICLPSLLKAM